jgi:hypothetical protein
MFPERNEWPSTAGEAEERSGYTELCEVPANLLGYAEEPGSSPSSSRSDGHDALLAPLLDYELNCQTRARG